MAYYSYMHRGLSSPARNSIGHRVGESPMKSIDLDSYTRETSCSCMDEFDGVSEDFARAPVSFKPSSAEHGRIGKHGVHAPSPTSEQQTHRGCRGLAGISKRLPLAQDAP
ncbi:unnamed protein product [Urochloa humidicola]